jgi:carbonic anhydrase
MTHHCSTLVLQCIDFRLGRPIPQLLGEMGILGDCDIVSIAGAAKTLATPTKPSHRETALDQIDIAVRLHSIDTVLLINHEDCGAYGGRAAFSSPEAEEASHAADMALATEVIRTQYPRLRVKQVLARISEAGQVSFQIIA